MSLCAAFVPHRALVLPTPAACRFLSAGEFVHAALSAYYAACQSLHPPEGEPWLLEGSAWASPEDFRDHLLREVGDRLVRTAIARGYAIEQTWPEPDEADAVGAAHGDALDLLSADPLFLASAGQQLPPVITPDHTQTQGARP